jgi:hypothetical protein
MARPLARICFAIFFFQIMSASALAASDGSSNFWLSVATPKLWPRNRTIPVCWETNPSIAAQFWVRDAVAMTWESQEFASRKACGHFAIPATIPASAYFSMTKAPHPGFRNGSRRSIARGMVLNLTFINWGPACSSQKEFCVRTIAVFDHELSASAN